MVELITDGRREGDVQILQLFSSVMPVHSHLFVVLTAAPFSGKHSFMHLCTKVEKEKRFCTAAYSVTALFIKDKLVYTRIGNTSKCVGPG